VTATSVHLIGKNGGIGLSNYQAAAKMSERSLNFSVSTGTRHQNCEQKKWEKSIFKFLKLNWRSIGVFKFQQKTVVKVKIHFESLQTWLSLRSGAPSS